MSETRCEHVKIGLVLDKGANRYPFGRCEGHSDWLRSRQCATTRRRR